MAYARGNESHVKSWIEHVCSAFENPVTASLYLIRRKSAPALRKTLLNMLCWHKNGDAPCEASPVIYRLGVVKTLLFHPSTIGAHIVTTSRRIRDLLFASHCANLLNSCARLAR